MFYTQLFSRLLVKMLSIVFLFYPPLNYYNSLSLVNISIVETKHSRLYITIITLYLPNKFYSLSCNCRLNLLMRILYLLYYVFNNNTAIWPFTEIPNLILRNIPYLPK